MKPYFATFFRGRWLFLLALLVMLSASGAGAYFLSGSEYEASARIWIDRPPLVDLLGTSQGYGGAPAQQQGDILYQLIQTDSFMTAVVKETKASKALTGRPQEDRLLLAAVREKMAYSVVGPNTVTIGFSGTDPLLCQQVVQGAIDQYRAWVLDSRLEQSTAELQYYEKQLDFYKDQMDEAKQRYEKFQAEHPNLKGNGSEYLGLELARLQRDYESSRDLYATAQNKRDQVGLVENLSTQGRQTDFRILDKPTLPAEPAASLKAILKYLILGVGASFGLVVSAGILFTWMDRTVRTTDELAKLSDVPVLAVIPNRRSGARGSLWRWRTKGKRETAARRAADLAAANWR